MALHTDFTRLLGLDHPLVLAPMGGVSGGRLAAAVSNAGGLGLVGGGYGDPAWLRTELAIVALEARRPWGVGFITWTLTAEVLAAALASGPSVVMLSFGAVAPWARTIRERGCRLMCQVQDLAGAREALAAGADVLVAQGTEAGGHSGLRSTLPLVPAVVDLAGPVPVLAAGGIADGRGLAAALMLGAQGALVGTRFYATPEALAHPRLKQALVARHGDDTVRTRVFDVLRGWNWPAPIAGRALQSPLVDRWQARLPELAARAGDELPHLTRAQAEGDVAAGMVWAGECIDLIHDVQTARDLVLGISAAAEAQLRSGQRLIRPEPGAPHAASPAAKDR